ncbi:MAG: bacillithiol biosynthesis cysteine-adding enzyme BshC [Saprospiraceae bacterium]|nr:bacillithiol biosynthesis cysteine-adding enzyme BshC [Saprospiraceae bacterium]
MQKFLVPFSQIPQLAKTDVAYATGEQALETFYPYKPAPESFPAIVAARAAFDSPRKTLVGALKQQYGELPEQAPVGRNIDLLLNDHTWTVTTAHQPVLFAGPLYFLYKAITTVRLAREAEQALGSPHRVMPVFVLGSEDHDLEELNHARLFNKTITWQPGHTGPVGVMPSDTLAPVLEELQLLLGDAGAALFERVQAAYAPGQTFAQATRRLLHDLLGSQGLLVLTMDAPEMKRHFIPVMRDELLNQTAHRLVSTTIAQLEQAGFKAQAAPREINLFFMKPGLRERIVAEKGGYAVLNTDLFFSQEAMLAELEAHPEHFSPNVVLRPLYQELMLPNLAYVGGGGELAYWLERRSLFAHYGVPYPMLVRRNSVLWLDKESAKRRHRFGLAPEQLFADTDALVRAYVESNAGTDLSLQEEAETVRRVYEKLSKKAQAVDPTLEKAVLADGVKAVAAVAQWESRLLRAEKQRHETSVGQIRGLREKLFAGGNGLQERSENALPFVLKYGDGFVEALMAQLNPFDQGFVVLEETPVAATAVSDVNGG